MIRAQHDALLGANRQKEELTALIVHDLKNPLSSILSNAQYVLGRKQLGIDGERFAGRHPARVAVDGAAGDEPAGRVAQRGRRADPARDRVRSADAADRGCKEMGRRVEDKDQRLEPDVRRRGRADARRSRSGPARAREPDRQRVQVRARGTRRSTSRSLPATMDDGAEPAVRDPRARRGRGRSRAPTASCIFEKYGRVEGRGGRRARAAATGWAWCSAGAPSAFTAAPSGWRTARGRGGCFCVRLPRRAVAAVRRPPGPPLGAPRGGACRLRASRAKRGRLADETPGTRRLLRRVPPGGLGAAPIGCSCGCCSAQAVRRDRHRAADVAAALGRAARVPVAGLEGARAGRR